MPKILLDASKLPKVEIEDKTYYVFLTVTRYSSVVVDIKGDTWMYYHVPFAFKEKAHAVGSLPCQELCGHTLKRFHWSCLSCAYRRVWQGKAPYLQRLNRIYTLFFWQDKRHSKIKDFFTKRLLSVCESLQA